MKIYTPNIEERAFLYQEAHDLEPLVRNLGTLSVMVEKQKRDYRVTFMVAPESMGMRVEAMAADLYSATIAAKDVAIRQLNSLVNSMPRQHENLSVVPLH